MTIRLVSWNVRGLSGRDHRRIKSRVLRQELQRALIGGPVDFLLVQEHKMDTRACRRGGKLLEGRSQTYWSPAEGTRGGVCISIGEHWLPHVLAHGEVAAGRAMWIQVDISGSTVGILCLYAPVSRSERTIFWRELVDALPHSDSWVVGGDFNNTELAEDGSGGTIRGIHASESLAWENFILGIRGRDPWQTPGFSRRHPSLSFSWTNRQDCLIQRRLDRFYVGDWGLERGGVLGILPGTSLSDHAPVVLELDEPQRVGASRGIRIPDHLFSDTLVQEMIQSIWAQERHGDSISRWVADCIAQTSQFCQQRVRQIRQEHRDRERRLRHSVAALQRLREQHPEQQGLRERLAQALEQLRAEEEQRAEYSFHAQRSFWLQKGDRMSKEFFHAVGPRSAGETIRRLQDEQGGMLTDPEEIRCFATEFYRRLYTADGEHRNTREARAQVLEHFPRLVTEEMQQSLDAPFSRDELEEALHELPMHKCPGGDGLSAAFYRRYWGVVGGHLTEAYSEILRTGEMPQDLCSGLICLIPKGGDRTMIGQWRPITLLDTAYKILAKAISLRLAKFLPDLIHETQTGFVQDRSILDNIFTFWEATAWAQETHRPLSVLLLDFEKAYDRVDWTFLQMVLHRAGFSQGWIRGVEALYRTSMSQVLIGGRRGEAFQLSRSVRQGCPLAPFLFLFVAEAMGHFLRARGTGLCGLALPLGDHQSLLDTEFADDTALYIEGDVGNLERTRLAIETFCSASGAKINWPKSVGFWTGEESSRPDWGTFLGFRWIPRGQSARYLGCQVGLDISSDTQFLPVLESIRRKLLHWSTARLSLAGRALVVNQVLLATIWYVASCWCFSRGAIAQVRRLIRNFLWSGRDGSWDTRARVSWGTIIRPRREGGLGIIDPEMQSRALLVKLIVRGLTPGAQPWKDFLRFRLLQCSPPRGDEWSRSVRWIFTEAPITYPSSGFTRSLIRVWQYVRGGLILREPTCLEEVARQPLCWNPRVRDGFGRMLGQRSHIAWDRWESGPARSVGTWRIARELSEERLQEWVRGIRGVRTRRQELEAAIPEAWRAPVGGEWASPPIWMGQFSRTGVPLAVQASLLSGGARFFSVLEGGRLREHDRVPLLPLDQESEDPPWERVRVIASSGRRWWIDPSTEMVLTGWRLWLWESRPLSQVQWDPGEWFWPRLGREEEEGLPFFSYSTRLGRAIQLCAASWAPSRLGHWEQEGISEHTRSFFWRRLWDSWRPPKVSYFFWLVAHGGVAVGTWLRQMGHEGACDLCGPASSESLQHCLWSCPFAARIWGTVAELLRRMSCIGTLSWGTVAWLSLSGVVLQYEALEDSQGIVIHTSTWRRRPLASIPPPPVLDGADGLDTPWELIGSLAAWRIWCSRCDRVLGGAEADRASLIATFWVDLIHTLRASWERLSGDSQRTTERRKAFLRTWGFPFFLRQHQRGVSWMYRPPDWLF